MGPGLPKAVPSVSEQNQASTPLELFPVRYTDLPGWKADDLSQALPAFLKSCEKIIKRPAGTKMGPYREMGEVDDWVRICREAATLPLTRAAEIQYFFESRFQPFSVGSRWTSSGIFTGYYEADLNGAFRPDQRYRYPVFSRPKDLISADLGKFDPRWKGQKIAGRLDAGKFVPYHTRAQIEAGALTGRQLELLWADDPVDVFFLQIQGSGRVNLPDGSVLHLAYAGRNGRPYTAVGRELVAAGEMPIEEVSMPGIRHWMRENPVAGDALRKKNQSYIFFKIRNADGPIGAQGVVLSPGRSMAVDPSYIPYGVPLWLVTTDPGSDGLRPLRRLVVAQDTGSAIRGAVRGDLFWGHGRVAAEKAGQMNEKGKYFLLLPKPGLEKPVTRSPVPLPSTG